MSASVEETLKVMVVDDSRLSKRIILADLEKVDHLELSLHEEPISALEEIEAFMPDLIVSDQEMPSVTGLEFCRRIRLNPKFKKTPFIIISGIVDTEFNADALEAGVNETIRKGFKHHELSKVVERYACQKLGGSSNTILIVDDSRFNRNLMVKMVQDTDARVFEAKDAVEGQAILDQRPIDLILLDYEMPGMKGVEWCQLLKQDERYKETAIISVSATKDVSLEFLGAGADDFIHKPFTRDEVNVKVQYQMQRVAMEKQMKGLVEKEKALNHQKNTLLGTAAHDIRNPVATIISFLELIKDKEFNDELVEMAVDSSYRQAQKALDLLNDILDVSNIDSGHLSLETKKVDFSELLDERVQEMRPLGTKKNIEVTFTNKVDGELAIMVLDPVRIGQVVDNLLTNAIKYSHKNTSTEVTLSKSDDGWLVQVADQGQGIPEDELPCLFGEFTKTSVKTTGGESSNGLGLAIVKKIIEAHGGVVWAESELEKGSVFSFNLPFGDTK